LRVVDHGLGAKLSCELQLVLAAGSANDPCADRARQLHQQDAEPAARRHHQHPFLRPDLGRLGKAQRGAAVMKERCHLAQAKLVRHRDQSFCRDHCLLGVAAPPGGSDDAPARPARVHTLADGDHLSGDAGTRDIWRLYRKVPAMLATADLRIDEQDIRDGDADHGLSRPGDRVRRLGRR
jgi:hypothetical protein